MTPFRLHPLWVVVLSYGFLVSALAATAACSAKGRHCDNEALDDTFSALQVHTVLDSSHKREDQDPEGFKAAEEAEKEKVEEAEDKEEAKWKRKEEEVEEHVESKGEEEQESGAGGKMLSCEEDEGALCEDQDATEADPGAQDETQAAGETEAEAEAEAVEGLAVDEEDAAKKNDKPWNGIELVQAGLSGTGQVSLEVAFTQLGYTVSSGDSFKVPGTDQFAAMKKAMNKYFPKPGDKDDMLEYLKQGKVEVALGTPLNNFWKLFLKKYNSKVLLTLHPRGASGWVNTLVRFCRWWPLGAPYHAPKYWEPLPGCRLKVSPKAKISKGMRIVCEKVYEDYNDAIKASVPKQNLLVYTVGDGWDPLCNFLGSRCWAAVPSHNGQTDPFPHVDMVLLIKEKIEKCGVTADCIGQVNGRTPVAGDEKLIPKSDGVSPGGESHDAALDGSAMGGYGGQAMGGYGGQAMGGWGGGRGMYSHPGGHPDYGDNGEETSEQQFESGVGQQMQKEYHVESSSEHSGVPDSVIAREQADVAKEDEESGGPLTQAMMAGYGGGQATGGGQAMGGGQAGGGAAMGGFGGGPAMAMGGYGGGPAMGGYGWPA